MRAASFAVPSGDKPTTDVSVIPLPGMGGRELDLVNLWRGQVQLPPVEESEMNRQAEPVAIGADEGKLFDMASIGPIIDEKWRMRVVVAMIVKGETSWFFKMTGEDASVVEQKPAFVQFLKTVAFAEQPSVHLAAADRPVSTNVREVPAENSERPLWVVPPGWQEQPGAQMLLAKFIIPGPDDKQAELNVSMLSGAGGGLLANVNRWRGQIQLPPVDDAALSKQIETLDLASGKATLVDMNGTDAKSGQRVRVLAAIVPQSDRTWFYRMMGDEAVVELQKEVFKKFIQTIEYPHVY